MARKNPKPGGKVDWDATGEIVEPNAGRKTSGWLFDVKPPAQNFNWLWNLLGLQQFYSNAQVQDWIVVDSDADEGDYATLTAYLADAPAAGNRILIKEDQTVTVQTVIPDDITLKFLDGSRLLCATNIATSILQMGSNIIIEGVLKIVLSQTGTTDKAIEYNGDNVIGQVDIENSSTGTLTTAGVINSGKKANKADIVIDNTGGGTVTNVFVDNSTNSTNAFMVRDLVNDSIFTIPLATDSNDGFLLSTDKVKVDEGLTFDIRSAENAGIVTILSTTTTIATIDLGTVTNGDIIDISGICRFTRGAANGDNDTRIAKDSGTATIKFFSSRPDTKVVDFINSNQVVTHQICGKIQVTGSGTLVINLAGVSALINSSVAVGDGQVDAYFLRKQ